MKVLHLVKTGDGAAWAVRQVAVLAAAGVDVVVALPSADAPRAPEYRAAGAEVVGADLDFTARTPWKLAGALARCRRLVDAVKPDLVHSHFVSTTLVARLALGKRHDVPRLFQVPGVLHLEHEIFRRLDLATAGPRDAWIASCAWTRDAYVRAGVPAERVFLSYYGTEPRRFRAARDGRLRAAAGIAGDAPLVGMVAHMYAPKRFLGQTRGLKGHEDFIAAVALLRARRPALRAAVVGGAWNGAVGYERRLRALGAAACGDAIAFTGPRDDVPAVYADLDVAVHPSLSENCGGAVESLAAACPTVATAVGGLPDVVVDGETGGLVPPRDPGALAAAIEDAIDRRFEAVRRARKGQDLVATLFDVERTGREVADIYRRVRARRATVAAEGTDVAEATC